MTTLFVKAPTEILDFTITWTDWLTGGETIATSSWTADAGITIDSDSNTGTIATVWLSSGTLGNVYSVTNTIVTDNATPRTGVRVLSIYVANYYISLADLRTELGVNSASDDGLLTQKIYAAQAYIDAETNGIFVAETATKYYSRAALYRYDSSILEINDDLQTITTLTNGDSSGTVITAAQYWLGGVDDKALNRNLGAPYHAIKLTEDSGAYWTWDTDGWVSILGTWSRFSEPPGDIKEAMLQLSSYFYRLKDSQVFDITATPELGVLTIPKGIPVGVVKIIAKYKRYF